MRRFQNDAEGGGNKAFKWNGTQNDFDIHSRLWHDAAMKRRDLISAVAFVAFVCIALGVLALLPPRPGVTKANFDRIAARMTKVEVNDLLGFPGDLSPNGTCWSHLRIGKRALGHEKVVWGGDDGAAVIVFDEEDRVTHEGWVDNNNRESFTDKLRRWLHLPK